MHDDGEPRQGHKLSPWPLMSLPAGRAGHPGGVRARCSQQARRGALTGTGGRSPLRPDPRSGGATGRIFTWKENVELHGGYIGRDLRVAEMLFMA